MTDEAEQPQTQTIRVEMEVSESEKREAIFPDETIIERFAAFVESQNAADDNSTIIVEPVVVRLADA